MGQLPSGLMGQSQDPCCPERLALGWIVEAISSYRR